MERKTLHRSNWWNIKWTVNTYAHKVKKKGLKHKNLHIYSWFKSESNFFDYLCHTVHTCWWYNITTAVSSHAAAGVYLKTRIQSQFFNLHLLSKTICKETSCSWKRSNTFFWKYTLSRKTSCTSSGLEPEVATVNHGESVRKCP